MTLCLNRMQFTLLATVSMSVYAQSGEPDMSAPIASGVASSASALKLSKELNESVTSMDIAVRDMFNRQITGKVVITQFKPDGDGPFPILILNHGRSGTNRAEPPRFRYTQQVRYFVQRGFAVFVPTRIGYGEMGVSPDPEESGSCNRKNYAPMAEAASAEILEVLAYAKKQSYVDSSLVLIVGQSVGGYSTVATVAKNPSGLIAAINFAGGSGGDPVTHPGEPCEGYKLEKMYASFGETSKAPMLWIYTENDQYFSPTYSRAWHAAFVKAGGKADYKLLPSFGKDGHSLFAAGIKIWEPLVSEFLDVNGFVRVPNK
ncbi:MULTISPECIES: prolyl oligopeptidase family serine peptidase [unclassified Undibacterium]|uniref:dienelactone hydrolase family protein n=3 Tax=Undibacterium TaxID=401469 RepID=UPI002B23049F|nr:MULTISPECIES: prolyl oligopeptidase family serine peptidase [unclassified Undibacterium]